MFSRVAAQTSPPQTPAETCSLDKELPTMDAKRGGLTRSEHPQKRIRATCTRVGVQSCGRGVVRSSRAKLGWPRNATPGERPCRDRLAVRPGDKVKDRLCPTWMCSHPPVLVTLLSSSGSKRPILCATLFFPAGTRP